ncbi:TPA: mechanosensitive ion channel family protein [Streptococcus agalactiae]|uniref:mechanosensitive ion channel family protein n=1 Tax=Streptococcus agalactiae TaxID=1311 RepID=UPI000332E555|nr:mechanosensitive ion channel family protein [Streptococcus agalactiae]CCW41219.1 Potassium efflux system KefA protein / Small-conductance mechanosensitive channel [Streptococcus agalactiae ILRI112]MCP9190646.1 mechanosensitive ion channel family protein [Streptococcus agalactiae]OTG48083.1 mechanosensitive ion channel protein [Streptococcus agalactiae]OTG49348.1 mechanosensitive ion channel protein [Streptococcus agalactiae]OTG54577.1 mechanosensitive ion channel protein [Streptococcus agal
MITLEKFIDHLNVEEVLFTFFTKLISILLLIIAFVIVRQVINCLFEKTVNRSLAFSRQKVARQKTLAKLSHNVLNYTLYFFLFYWILSILGVPISSLLAGAGIAGVAIGLGAQGFLSDVVNGFFILLENQFDVGDIINVGTVSGTVTNVGIRTTQIHDFDGTLHFIPNRNITIVSNKSRSNMRAQIDIPLFVHTNLDQISDIVTKINEEYVSKHPAIVGEPTVFGPTTNANGQFVYRINIFTQNGAQFDIYAEFYKLYQKAILEKGIDLPTYNFSNNHSR